MVAVIESYDRKEIRMFYKIKHTGCCSFICNFKDDFKITNYRGLNIPSEAVIKCPRCGKELKFSCKIGKDTPINVDNYKEYIEEISEEEYVEYLSKSLMG